MLDIEAFRRRIGLLQERSIIYKPINKDFSNAPLTTKKNCLSNNAIVSSIIN